MKRNAVEWRMGLRLRNAMKCSEKNEASATRGDLRVNQKEREVCGFFCRSPLTFWEQKRFFKRLLRCLIKEHDHERSDATCAKSGLES